MIARILDSPIVDIILVILALRFIFPSLFTMKVIKINRQQPYRENPEGSIHIKSSAKKNSGSDDSEGEYIDYEEVK